MKKILKEFKEFITRGNVIDLAVGMIIGAAFTAIVTALVNGIFKPLINWIPLGDVNGLITMLVAKNADGQTLEQFIKLGGESEQFIIDLTQSIYINWGDFIMAIVTFLLTAVVLFAIVKIINVVRNVAANGKAALEKKLHKGEVAEEDVVEEVVEEAPAVPVETSEDLLREIRDLLKANQEKE